MNQTMKVFRDKRIGLILASIHTGSSLNLWTALAREAERAGAAFFIFPGGRLESLPDSEYLRNSIYRLANKDNLESLISWGSSLGGAVSMEELDRFHHALEPLPYVTIAHRMKGHPSVKFDAYTGMKALMDHFLKVHGSRKILFLRGPSDHLSAEDRFRAYRDSLEEAGIGPEVWEPLVSDPFPWSEGLQAAEQLYGTRGLIPGRDFDTLLGASDMMVLAAVQLLETRGYHMPGDFLCGGFNDSAESRILTHPFSTVHMPYTELGLAAFRLVRSSVRGDDRELILPMELVIRESCGCRTVSGNIHPAPPVEQADRVYRREGLFEALLRLFRLDDTDRNAYLEPLLGALEEGREDLFLTLFDQVLFRYFESDREPRLIFRALGLVKETGCFDPATLERLEVPALQAVARVQGRVTALKNHETGKRYRILNSLKCDLLCARDRSSLIAILAAHLPRIGITMAAVVIQEDEEYSRLLGGFFPGGGVVGEGELFLARHLLPDSLTAHRRNGVFLVQPLFMENQYLGYLVCQAPFFDGTVFEELRSSVSSALKGIYLFEETLEAKRRAETAERTRTEFFANVGNDLCDPLEELSEGLEGLTALLSRDPGGENPAHIHDAARFLDAARRAEQLRALLTTQIDRTNRLLDLTLSQTDELIFQRRLLHREEILPDDGGDTPAIPLPLLYGDPGRFRQALLLFREVFTEKPEVLPTYRGLEIRLTASAAVSDRTWGGSDLQLAEKLVLLQFGEVERGERGCRILLPWPNLAGLPPAKTGEPEGILELSEEIPRVDRWPLPRYCLDNQAGEALPTGLPENLILSWNPDSAPLSRWLFVHSLRHHPRLFRAPFLCYGKTLRGEGLIQALEARVAEEARGPVLVVSDHKTCYRAWAPEGSTVHITSIEGFAGLIREITPSLVVFEAPDLEAIRQIRRHPSTGTTPILILPERLGSWDNFTDLLNLPHVLFCHRGLSETPEFSRRTMALQAGKELLPPHTGALVKKALLYLENHATTPLARWKLAHAVNLSEDYLTRIFHREMGFSPWEYLSRYRILLATEKLLNSDDTINQIALDTGFQDQAYFCRVFKKIHGVPPKKFRSRGV